MAKIVRFKGSATETNHSASCRIDVQSTSCEASEDLPMSCAAVNEPKTSEFAFFKRLKQDVGHTSHQNPESRMSFPVRKFRPSGHARERGNSKHDDIKFAKKTSASEIGSFLSQNNLPSEHSDTPIKEHDSGRFNSFLLKTPTNVSLDSFLSYTANASVKPESQQNEGDVFSSKRQKLLQHIARTLFPESDEVPTECNLLTLLLSRLLPESSQETLSQILPLKQPEPNEKNYQNLDSNVRHKETMDTLRKIEGNEHGGLPSRNLLAWGNEFYGCSSRDRSPEILTYGPCTTFSYGTYGSGQSPEFRDHEHSYEVLDGSYNSLTTANSGSVCKIQDFNSNRREQLSPNCWFDFSSRLPFERFRLSALDNLRDYSERNYANDFEITREHNPLLLGWDPNKVDISESAHTRHMKFELYRPPSSNSIQDHWNRMDLDVYRPSLSTRNEDHWDPSKSDISDCDSAHAIHMELEIYCPPFSTRIQDNWDSPELDIYRPLSATRDHWDMENGSLMHLSPNTCNAYDVQGHHLQGRDLVPKSPRVPYMLTYGPEELNPVGSSLFKNASKSSSFFTIPHASYSPLENMMCDIGAEGFISKDSQSDTELKYKSLTGFLRGQYETHTEDVHKLVGQSKSIPQFLFDSAENLAISHPEEHFFMSECTRIGEQDSLSLLLDTVNWRGTAAQTYDEDKAKVTFR